ncbi:MAG: glucose 1-dehydrogenase [Actinobacteria bacterium]|jgi:NAD(P)-dependent dehydrogenase (short-subunit alcohol dehydrogenase family)|nr:glucose 1-dehydrogenase [Actinomycetota bacterium]
MITGIEGKVAVVTGGASGIGRATALAFARKGAKLVVVTGRSVAAAEETADQIVDMGGEAVFIKCDVSDEAQVEAMVAEVVARFGRVDFAFNNAGVGPDGVTIPFAPLTDVTEDDWDSVVDTNLKGVFLCLKHELRQMREQGSGAIVNTSSTAGIQMKGGFGGYCPSKAGVIALTKIAAIENKDKGIRVNAVCPGPTKGTGMSDRMLSVVKDGPPLEVMGEPDDVARVVIWLCSNEASFVDGNVLAVDGGLDIA